MSSETSGTERRATGSAFALGKIATVAVLIALAIALPVFASSAWLLPLMAVCVACFDWRRPVSGLNVAVIYYALVLGAGPYVLRHIQVDEVHRFGCLAGLGLLAGLGVGRTLVHIRGTNHRAPAAVRFRDGVDAYSVDAFPGLLVVLALAQSAIVALDISDYGLHEYLQAASQVNEIATYASGGLDAVQLFRVVLDLLTVAVVAAYLAACQGQGLRPQWRLVLLVMILIPVLRFERGAVVVNILSLLLIARIGQTMRPRSGSRSIATVVGALGVMFVVGVVLGGIRASELGVAGSDSGAGGVLRGEFSVVIPVDGGLSRAEPYGVTGLVRATLERPLPRRLYPDKARNMTERYMLEEQPDAFRAGFSLAPTALGTLVLAGGVKAAFGASAIVGMLIGAFPVGRRRSIISVGYVCCVYLSLYSLLRNDISNSVTQLIGSLILFRVILTFTSKKVSSPEVVSVP